LAAASGFEFLRKVISTSRRKNFASARDCYGYTKYHSASPRSESTEASWILLSRLSAKEKGDAPTAVGSIAPSVNLQAQSNSTRDFS